MLQSIIRSIHHNINSKQNLLCVLPYASAEPFAQIIEQLSSTFTTGHQEDPSEFLVFLLNHLGSCLTPLESHIDVNSLINPIQHIFGLYIQSVSKCNVCLGESAFRNWEAFLSISIVAHPTLVEALAAFFSKEELHGDNLYECINCQIKVTASKTLQIIKALPVIFIHLKRFTYDKMSQMTRKIHQYITYPEMLNLNPYFDENIRESNKENDSVNSFIYQLNSVVVHLGKTPTSGHIFAYVRSPDGLWYKANDESITSVKLDMVLGDKDAYILCYTKVPKSTTGLSNTELIRSPVHSSSFLTSSTPIHSSRALNIFTNNYTTVRKMFLFINIYSIFMSYLDKFIEKYFCFF